MLDREPEGSGEKYSRRQVLGLLGKSLLAVPFVAACGSTPTSEKRIPFIEAKQVLDDTTGLSPQEIATGRLVRANIFRTFREFVPTFFLEKGLYVDQDGDRYWGRVVKEERLRDGTYFVDFTAKMGEGKSAQEYSAAGRYDSSWKLELAHIRAGSVPAYIIPQELPREVPGFRWLNLPPSALREVAEMVYDLPNELEWRETSYIGKQYMAGPPNDDRKFTKLIATGRTADDRVVNFSIDEQSFSGIDVISKL